MTNKPADPGAIRDLMAKIYINDPITWGQQMFPHHFTTPDGVMKVPPFHFELIDAVVHNRFVAIAAPRGSAKTTLLVFLYPAHQIIFKKKKFILIVSNTFAKAARQLDTIKREFVENKVLSRMFPGITFDKDAQGDTIFRHPDGFSTLVLCKGVDQIGSVRGEKHGASRPDLIICDDLEDDELVRNPERRVQLQQLYDEALVPAGATNVQVVVIGTIFHDDAQMAKLVSPHHYQEYFKLFFKALEDTGNSLWPEKWSLEFLAQLKKEKPNVFAKEYQNDPVAGTNTRFKRSDFRYWEERDGRISILDANGVVEKTYSFPECRAAVACDLAWKEKRTSDSSVLMPGLLTPNSEILVSDYISKKGMRPDETGEHLFLMVDRLKKLTHTDVPVGFEKAMLENVTQWLLKLQMRNKNTFITTKALVWDADKHSRIETRLEPRLNQHVIYFKRGMGELEYELERFPYGVHDDHADCLQALVQLLQFPKKPKPEDVGDDIFAKLRKLAIDEKYGIKEKVTGKNQKDARWWDRIPSKKALW